MNADASTSKITDADWIVKDLKTRAVQIVLLIRPIDNEDNFFANVSTLKRSPVLIVRLFYLLNVCKVKPLLLCLLLFLINLFLIRLDKGGLTIEDLC